MAGSKTTQTTTSNFISFMLHEPEQFDRLRAEIDPFFKTVKDDLIGKMTQDAVKELPFIKMAYMETLRCEPPAAMSTTITVLEEMKIGDITFLPNDPFWVDMRSLHYD